MRIDCANARDARVRGVNHCCARTSSVKSLRISITPAEAGAPESNLAAASPDVHRHLILGGSVLDGRETTISYIEGDPEAVESMLEASSRIDDFDVTPSGGGCSLYCQQELTDSALTLFDAFPRRRSSWSRPTSSGRTARFV